MAVGSAGSQQVGHDYSAAGLQRQIEGLELVAQVLAQRFTVTGGGFRVHIG